MIQRLPEGQVKDGAEVAAAAQVIWWATDADQLRSIAGRIANQNMAECDLRILRKVWKAQMEEIANDSC